MLLVHLDYVLLNPLKLLGFTNLDFLFDERDDEPLKDLITEDGPKQFSSSQCKYISVVGLIMSTCSY